MLEMNIYKELIDWPLCSFEERIKSLFLTNDFLIRIVNEFKLDPTDDSILKIEMLVKRTAELCKIDAYTMSVIKRR